MTKDEAREGAKYAALHRLVEEFGGWSIGGATLGEALFDAGWEARDAVTCVWRWEEEPSSNEEGWGTRCQKFFWVDDDKPTFCPNCGGKIVPPDSGEEKND